VPMKPTLAPGITTTREFAIDRERTIDFMGEEARVYATPMLVRDIEVTCRELLLAHLDAGEDSVGTRVEIDHLAATLLGMKVTITATLAELKGRAAIFDVSASDGLDTICRGRHARFIANVEQVKQRLLQKRAKAFAKPA
jgi:fluoroacetyl-CoA thioesterase